MRRLTPPRWWALASLLPALAAAQLAFDFDPSVALHRVSDVYVAFNIDTGSLYNGMNFSDVKFRKLVSQLTLGGSGAGSTSGAGSAQRFLRHRSSALPTGSEHEPHADATGANS